MKWSEMTSIQRDALIAEKIMGIDPAMPCSGTFVPNPHDGHETLYCPKCDAGIFFGDSKTHKQPLVPRYTTDMNAALQIIELDRFSNVSIERQWRNEHIPPELRYLCRIVIDGDLYYCNAATAQEAVCLAAWCACEMKVEE
jgi:hypothetical protein